MIDSPPKIVSFAVDLHENLVQMPAPLARFHAFVPAFADLGGEHWAEAMPPISHRFVVDIDVTLMEQVFHIAQRQRETDAEHNCQADSPAVRFEKAEWLSLFHGGKLRNRPARLSWFALTVPLQEIVHVPLSFGECTQLVDSLSTDLRSEHWTEPVPPITDRFMAYVDTAFMQQIFDIPKRKRETDIQYHRQSDNFRAALKALERVRFGHFQTSRGYPDALKRTLADSTGEAFAENSSQNFWPSVM